MILHLNFPEFPCLVIAKLCDRGGDKLTPCDLKPVRANQIKISKERKMVIYKVSQVSEII